MYLSFRVSNGSLILLFSTLLIVYFCQLLSHVQQKILIHLLHLQLGALAYYNEIILYNCSSDLSSKRSATGNNNTCRWGP